MMQPVMNIRFHTQYDISDDKTLWRADWKEGEEMKVILVTSVDQLLEGLRGELVKKLAPGCVGRAPPEPPDPAYDNEWDMG